MTPQQIRTYHSSFECLILRKIICKCRFHICFPFHQFELKSMFLLLYHKLLLLEASIIWNQENVVVLEHYLFYYDNA